MRVSRYLVVVPLEDSRHLLYHGVFGVWDLARSEVAEALRRNQPESLNPEQQAYAQKRHYITDLSLEEERNGALRRGMALRRYGRKHATFRFVQTRSCNLACTYCFQGQMRAEANTWPILTTAQIDAAFRTIDHIMAQPTTETASVSLFGGEPLMESTAESVAYIVQKATARGLPVGAITNGVKLDLFTKLLGPKAISSVHFTLDGPPDIHDAQRCWADGTGTFSEVVRNIRLALSYGVAVTVRINIGAHNLHSLPQLVQFIDEQGWLSLPSFRAFVAFIYSPHQAVAEAVRTKRRAAMLIQNINRSYGRQVIGALEGLPGARLHTLVHGNVMGLTPVHCKAQVSQYIFDPDGAIYACDKLIGDPINRIGVYYPELVLSHESMAKWFARSSISIPGCQDCPHIFSCGGGCAMKALQRTGHLSSPYCESFDQLFKAELYSYFIGKILPPTPLCPTDG